MTADAEADRNGFRTIKALTNERQAAKVCDVTNDAALVAAFESGRTVWISSVDQGFRAVGYGSAGGLYMSRVVTGPQVTAMLEGAEAIDVVHESGDVPSAVKGWSA